MAEIIQEIRIHQFLLSSDFCSNMYIYFLYVFLCVDVRKYR